VLNPQSQKIGERWLIQQKGYRYPIQEVTILEWAESGKHVKLKFMRGHIDWNDPTEYNAIEKLLSTEPKCKVDNETFDDYLIHDLQVVSGELWKRFEEDIKKNKKGLR
jgi:hypothetical protein